MRSALGFIGNNLMIAATALLPLSILIIITNTNVFWASLFGYYFLGDRLSRIEIFAMILGFGGIYLIIYNADSRETEIKESGERHLFILGIILALVISISSGSVACLTRKMKGIHYSVI